jgi:predicted negative regulator of RcsB-dependent stress response
MKKEKNEVSKSTVWMTRTLTALFVAFLIIVLGSIALDYFGGNDRYSDYPSADSPF